MNRKRYFNIVSVIILVSVLFSTSIVNAQSSADTTYANITFQTKNSITNNTILGVEVSVRPKSMQMIIPDTTYKQISDSLGEAKFYKIPVHIDTITSTIETQNANNEFVLINKGNEIIVSFNEFSKGILKIYNIEGQIVRQNHFAANKAFVNINDLANSIYIVSVQTENGKQFSSKFLKTQSPNGNYTETQNSTNNLRTTSFLNADFWVVYEKPAYYKDSLVFCIYEGNNNWPLNLTPIPIDTMWATGTFLTKDINNDSISNIPLSVKSNNISSIDTLIQLTTNANGTTSFKLPLLADLATQLPPNTSANYWIKWTKQNFKTDSALVNFISGNNGTVNLTILEQGVDLNVTVRDMNRSPLENVLMVLKEQTTGVIDTLRSDSAGIINFEDRPLGKSYFVALGGKRGFKALDGKWNSNPGTFIITTPSSITVPSDTLIEKNYILISDTLHSNLNNVDVAVTTYQIGVMFSRFNIHLSLHDTAFAHFKPAYWTQQVINIFENEQQSLSQKIGIPIQAQSTPFDLNAIINYNPWTTNPHLVGTNFVGGGNVTYHNNLTFTSGPFIGDYVIVACDSIKVSGNINAFAKEHFRWFGASDVSSRPSVMNPIPSALNDVDAALMNMYYLLGRNRYQFQVHDLPDMQYLRDTIMLISAPLMTMNESIDKLIQDSEENSQNVTLDYSAFALVEVEKVLGSLFI